MMQKPHAATALLFRIVKWGSLFVVSLALVLFFLLWLMLSGLGETTVYTERNLWDYNMLTEKAIAQAPRITTTYHLTVIPPSTALFLRMPAKRVSRRCGSTFKPSAMSAIRTQ